MNKSGYVVGIVHYRDPAAVRTLLESVATWALPPQEILIADNSGDLGGFLSDIAIAHCDVVVIDMRGNVGYAAAANRLVRQADGSAEFLLLLTQDARLEPKASSYLLDAMEAHLKIAVTVPVILYASNPRKLFSGGGRLLGNGRTLHPGQGDAYKAEEWSNRDPASVDWGDGACTMLRISSVTGAGGFDESYFLYVEEVDLQTRLRSQGYEIQLVPRALAYQEPGPYSLYYKYRNLTYFTRKLSLSLRPWPWPIAFPKDCLRMVLKGRVTEPLWAVRGLLDSWGGRMGPRPRSLFAPNSAKVSLEGRR
jgi:N-acetylglucosaminyl-diphospho-decaprenol L-rhamnosyltransferase